MKKVAKTSRKVLKHLTNTTRVNASHYNFKFYHFDLFVNMPLVQIKRDEPIPDPFIPQVVHVRVTLPNPVSCEEFNRMWPIIAGNLQYEN